MSHSHYQCFQDLGDAFAHISKEINCKVFWCPKADFCLVPLHNGFKPDAYWRRVFREKCNQEGMEIKPMEIKILDIHTDQ